jgi:hypothetical protein
MSVSSLGVTYELANPAERSTEARLVLKVSLDGRLVEEVELFSGSLPPQESTNRTLRYAPSGGWGNGTYAFRAELHSNGDLLAATADQALLVGEKRPLVVSWNILAIIVGIAVFAAAVTVAAIMRGRREVINTWVAVR